MKINETINYLTLLEHAERKGTNKYGIFRCKCGTEKKIRISAVTSQGTKSCGCHRRVTARKNGKMRETHGETNTPLHVFWINFKSKHKEEICNEWKDFVTFAKWAKENCWKKGLVPCLVGEHSVYGPDTCELIDNVESKKINTERTCLERYGTPSPLQNEEVKKKIVETCLDKYGVPHACMSEEVKEKTRKNNIAKYGVEYPQLTDEYRLKMSRRNAHNLYDGKTTREHSLELDISYTALLNRIKNHGFDTAISMERGQTNIEFLMCQLLDSLSIKYRTNVKIEDRYADFVIDDYNIIIECDGIYWHSDAINKDNKYHKNKMNLYFKHGYRTFFFREDEIINKLSIIKSIICNACRKNINRVFARKCDIVELDNSERKLFFEDNHLMGRGRGKCFGLKYNNELVCSLQYTNREGLVDISRFSSTRNTSVIGGYSKLMKHVERKESPHTIQTFVDRRYGTGDYLEQLGFEKKTEYLSFVWVRDAETFHRLKYRGSTGYDHRCFKLWDCGQAKWTKTI